MAEWYQKSKTTYPDLIIRQIQIIQGIASKEMRDCTRTIKTPIGEQIVENEDTRYSFLQSVELFGSLLSPYFNDEKIKTTFNNFIVFYDSELIELLNNNDFKRVLKEKIGIEIKDVKEVKGETKTQLLVFLLNEKVKEARKLFRALVECFKKNKFLLKEGYISRINISDRKLDIVEEPYEEVE